MSSTNSLLAYLPDPALMKMIADQYQLDPDDTHGISHWGRVLENGLALYSKIGGDPVVISLFAVFHDACRHNQTVDPGHGQRGAELATQLLHNTTIVTQRQLSQLVTACQLHTDGHTQEDLTIQCCWDADRLDLARAGITPSSEYLCTNEAKSPSVIRWASRRSVNDFTPRFVTEQWRPLFSL